MMPPPLMHLHLLEYRHMPTGRRASLVRHDNAWLMTFSKWNGEHKTWELVRQTAAESLQDAQQKAHEWCCADDDKPQT